MLSDSRQHQKMPSPATRGDGWHYPDSTKLDALKLWLVTGNLRQVSSSMNIPYETLKTWRYSKWWKEMSLEIRTEGHLQLSAKMQKIADKAMEVTLDRLENGDTHRDPRTGEMYQKPVNMRDAHQAAVSFQDRALKLQNSPAEEANQLAVHDRLAQLADAFAKMAGKTKRLEVLDVSFTEHEEVQPQEAGDQSQEADAQARAEVLDAIHDEGQEGLQEGGELGEDQGQTSLEGPGSANSST